MFASRLVPAFAALAVLGACATATPYQAASSSDRGYAEQQIENDRWQVSFEGNSLTPRETVETYLLYRAAELTQEQGFEHFRVVQRDTDENSRYVPLGYSRGLYSPYHRGFYCSYRFYDPFPTHFYSSRRGVFADPFGAPEYREIVRYEASAEIIVGSSDDTDDPSVFTASEVLANLADTIVRPEDLA